MRRGYGHLFLFCLVAYIQFHGCMHWEHTHTHVQNPHPTRHRCIVNHDGKDNQEDGHHHHSEQKHEQATPQKDWLKLFVPTATVQEQVPLPLLEKTELGYGEDGSRLIQQSRSVKIPRGPPQTNTFSIVI